MSFRLIFMVVFALGVASSVAAQDTHTVIEPFFPELCTTLDAHLQSSGRFLLAPADEKKLDTARIQKAIDKCGKGRAVLLHVNEVNNAFLSGPLELRRDVTLIIGLGVTLFASRDPALYAISQGSCDIVSHEVDSRGCKPLIAADHAPNSAVMGDGTIDGRDANLPALISAEGSNRVTLYRITLRNPPSVAVFFARGDGLTVWRVHVDRPQGSAGPALKLGEGAKSVTITASNLESAASPATP